MPLTVENQAVIGSQSYFEVGQFLVVPAPKSSKLQCQELGSIKMYRTTVHEGSSIPSLQKMHSSESRIGGCVVCIRLCNHEGRRVHTSIIAILWVAYVSSESSAGAGFR